MFSAFPPLNISSIEIYGSILFVVLTMITIYRKELSANRKYREENAEQEEIISRSRRSSSATTVNNELVLKYNEKSSQLIEVLARDLIFYVCSFLEAEDIVKYSRVSKTIRKEIHTDLFWEQLWKSRYGKMWNQFAYLREWRNIHWNPMENWGAPTQGWIDFYIEFECSWVDWLLAACNTNELCLCGFNGNILDVTSFSSIHPGTTDTLLEAGGGDVTNLFHEIGHSWEAKTLAESCCICEVGYYMPLNYSLNKGFGESMINFDMSLSSALNGTRKEEEPDGRIGKLTAEYRALKELISQDTYMTVSQAQKPLLSRPTLAMGGNGNTTCTENHLGLPRLFYDPLNEEWNLWWVSKNEVCCLLFIVSLLLHGCVTLCVYACM